MLEHIIRCVDCQDEIDRLRTLFERLDKEKPRRPSRRDSAVATLLQLHFGYVNQPVTCSTARLFLASMADPALQIRIPTPITKHIDECRVCRDDLLSLQDLHITELQLSRLSQLLADESSKDVADTVSCYQAQTAIGSVGSMAFHETNAEVLNHLCTCPDCRKQLYLHRENLCRQLQCNGNGQTTLPCESISVADIYDFCVPYGIDPADEQYVKPDESIASHLRNCPTCLARMQSLHNTVYGIAQRPDCEVATCFTLKVQDDGVMETGSNGIFADRILDVQAPSRTEPSTSARAKALPNTASLSLRQRVSSLNLKRYTKPAIAAAAAIVIAYASFFSTPAVEGTAFNRIAESLEEIRNVCTTQFHSGSTEPTQTKWISQTLNVLLLDTDGEYVLWDAANRIKKTRLSPSDSVETEKLLAEMLDEIEMKIGNSTGLLPFSRMTNIPEGSQWSQVDNESVETSIAGVKVYDMTRTIGNQDRPRFRRWRFYVDASTDLPRKWEFYSKRGSEAEYTLGSFVTFTYPTDGEIEQAIQSRFGQ
ncbi:MAG: hypothetical protein U9Q07_03280 [Planctomycetota bacterium]|nr:hypothetical protein [Planctomycetota bacterium]